jgi:hypothetical protein
MAVHVMLDFDNDEDAKRLVRFAILNGGVEAPFNQVDDPLIRCTPRGVWKKPLSFCDDQPVGHRSDYLKRIKSKMGGWTRGPKFGWWVDPACGRPTRDWAEGHRWWYSLGTNLLPKPYATEDTGQETPQAQAAMWYDVLPEGSSKEG